MYDPAYLNLLHLPPYAICSLQWQKQTIHTRLTETSYLASKTKKHTTAGIRWWSPTQLLTGRRVAYVWIVVRWVPLQGVRWCELLALARLA